MPKANGAGWSLLGLVLAITACTTVRPSPHPEASALEGLLRFPLVRIDLGVAVAPDNRTITITFIGGPDLPRTDPCYTEYAGWARVVGQHLDLAVARVVDIHPAPGTACAAVGQERIVQVVLEEPFLGETAQDLSDGHLLQIERAPS
jgi:hypothetical protein